MKVVEVEVVESSLERRCAVEDILTLRQSSSSLLLLSSSTLSRPKDTQSYSFESLSGGANYSRARFPFSMHRIVARSLHGLTSHLLCFTPFCTFSSVCLWPYCIHTTVQLRDAKNWRSILLQFHITTSRNGKLTLTYILSTSSRCFLDMVRTKRRKPHGPRCFNE